MSTASLTSGSKGCRGVDAMNRAEIAGIPRPSAMTEAGRTLSSSSVNLYITEISSLSIDL